MRWRSVGFCGLAWDVSVKDVERLAPREGPEVIVLRVRERRGVFMRFERWKLDRMVAGSLAAPRAPNAPVRSIFVGYESRASSSRTMEEGLLQLYKYKLSSR